MSRIVSLTPIAVEHDSRTFKQAASVARLGHESILVEGLRSGLDRGELPFRLVTAATQPSPSADLSRSGTLLGGLRRVAHACAPTAYNATARSWRLGPRTARSVPGASLYYLHSPHQYPAMWLRSRGEVPFIYDAHDFYPASYAPTPGESGWFRTLLWWERRCVRNAAEVVTVTEGCADLIEDYFGRRPIVIPNVHDPRMDEPPPRGLRSSLQLSDDDFLLVMTGNAKAGTAVAEALDALTELPARVHLALVGKGWPRHSDLVEARGLGDRVHLLSGVPPSQVTPFIASADAAVILYLPHTANYVHSLPNRLFTAIAAGLPVLYPVGLPGLRALAEHHELGLPIDPTQPASVAAATRTLLDDGSARSRFAANAATASEILTWERHESVLGVMIEAALARTPRGFVAGTSRRFRRGIRREAGSR